MSVNSTLALAKAAQAIKNILLGAARGVRAMTELIKRIWRLTRSQHPGS
jgi:hypothetical protein